MHTIPTALWPYLLSQRVQPVEVYEIEAFAGRSTLRYSNQDVTWGGNDYIGLAVERSKIKESMEFRVPDCTITFSNVTNVLRAHLAPTDTLTGARLTVRLLLKDAGGTPLTDSLVLFRGRIEPPKAITETEFVLSVRGLIDGMGVETPARRLSLSCQWSYANDGLFDGNGHCSYVSNTTANVAGTNSTSLTIASTTANGAGSVTDVLVLTAASGFKNGDLLKIGTAEPVGIAEGGGTTTLKLKAPRTWSNGTSVFVNFLNGDLIQIGGGTAVTVGNGGGTSGLTLTAQRTWSNGATIRYATCPQRSRFECEQRGMLHRFGGHPGVADTSRLGAQKRHFIRPHAHNSRQNSGFTLMGPRSADILQGRDGDEFATPNSPLAVLYGRRLIGPLVFEDVQEDSPYRVILQHVVFHSIGVGEIDGVVFFFLNDVLTLNALSLLGGAYTEQDLTLGIYVRNGTVGVADVETKQNYIDDPATMVRPQNIDYRSFAGIAYSEEAYAMLLGFLGHGPTVGAILTLDVKGLKVQLYDAAGAPSGSPVWSPNPIWQSVDWTAKDYGLDNLPADVDFAVTKPEADYAATLLTSSEAATVVTVAQGSASENCYVKSAEGFIPGRRVDVNGTANTVKRVLTDRILLGTAVTMSVGHTVVQRPQRFESHLYIAQVDRGTRWLQALLATCRGYVTYDAGKIQFRIERDTCKSRLTDGAFEVWTSATNLTNWTEGIAGGNTVNRESSIVRSGTFSLNLHVVDPSVSIQVSQSGLTGFEPGRWYRWVGYVRASGSDSNGARVTFRNVTKSKDLKTDGTWHTTTGVDFFAAEVTTAWQLLEITFRIDESFALTDSYTLFLDGRFMSAGTDLYWDDVDLRGPYAGDFRETTNALLMGWKSGSFVWSLDKRDRETNRVAVNFFNESGNFGDDTAVANDFDHQETYPTKSLNFDGAAIADRDQAYRIAAWQLAKRRTLQHGCQFLGTPAALPLQPGDVILVSHTVPAWTCKEQRVIDIEVQGLGDEDEHFVRVQTEDYLESIYSDVGPLRFDVPVRPVPVLNVSVTRNAGGVLELSMVLSDTRHSLETYRIYLSDTTGFVPDDLTRIGETTGHTFTYQVPVADLDVPRFLVVVATSAFATIQSDQFAVTIFRAEPTPPAGTGYSNDFKFPTTKTTVSGLAAFSGVVGDVTDASDATYAQGVATMIEGTAQSDDDGVLYHTFGNGTDTGQTGRPYVRAYASGGGAFGSHKLYYTLDRTVGSPVWVLWQQVTSSVITDYFGPELTGVDYSKFGIKGEVRMVSGGFIDRTITGRHYRVAFDKKA